MFPVAPSALAEGESLGGDSAVLVLILFSVPTSLQPVS